MKVVSSVVLILVCAIYGIGQTDVAKQVGIYENTKTWTATVADFNNDGWDDFILSRHYEGGAKLYRNDHGVFTNVATFPSTEANGLPVDRHDCEFADVNRDGQMDIYCTKGSDYGLARKENELWIRTGNSFTNKSVAWGVDDPWGRGRFCTFIDVNHDAYPDLFVANETGRGDGQDSRNHLFINDGGLKFVAAPQMGLDTAIGGGVCVKTADFDGDGWDDLLVCAGGSSPHLYHNNHGTSFTDISVKVGISTVGYQRDIIVADLDGDGQFDLAMVHKGGFQVMLNRGGVFQKPSYFYPLTAGEKLAAGDINRDGLPDIYIVQGGDSTTQVTAPTNPTDIFLVNVGDGKFVRKTFPQVWQGQGQHVSAIDYNRDGVMDFIVLNGFNKAEGPVQLLKFLKETQ